MCMGVDRGGHLDMQNDITIQIFASVILFMLDCLVV